MRNKIIICNIIFLLNYCSVISQIFPNPANLSTGQGLQNNLDPNWETSDTFDNIPTDLLTLNYYPALIYNDCAPGEWVNPQSLPSPINNSNWIISNVSDACNQIDVAYKYIVYRLTLNLPETCDGFNIAEGSNYTLYFSGYADNTISDVYLNGSSLGISGGGYENGAQINFNINGPWQIGVNYLDIIVNNTGPSLGHNPYGLLLVADYTASIDSDLDEDGIPDLFDDCPCDYGISPDGCCLLPVIEPMFTQVPSICSGDTLSAFPTTSDNGYTGTWSPALDNTATTTYIFTPDAGQCVTTASMTITVNPNITPTFTQIADICSGDSLSALPTTSDNGYTGTWLPTLDNTATTTYTFTPTAGQCATTASMTITVNPNITPTFTQIADICSGDSLSALPTTSDNGYTGTWLPTLDNTATTTYTFTPTAGQCATTASMTITVNPNITPTFTQIADICSGDTLSALPTTSDNGYTGIWSPALNNTTTTTYTFTPTAGQCATTASMTITVNELPATPTGNTTQTFCAIDNPKISDLVLTTNEINWYLDASNGPVLSPNYLLTDGLTLYAASYDSVTLCESSTRLPVLINLNNPSLPILNSEFSYCEETNPTIHSIYSQGIIMNWYDSLNNGNLIDDNYILQDGDILYGAALNIITGCESVNRVMVTISIIKTNLTYYNLISVDDAFNNSLKIENIEKFPENKMEIYNRYGTLVWKGINYNNVSRVFKGQANVSGVLSKDSYLPTGTYFFILNYPNNCRQSILKGFVHIDNKK